MRWLLAFALVVTACGTRADTPGSAASARTLEPSPSASAAPGAASATLAPTPGSFRKDAGATPPDLEIWATSWSGVVRRWAGGRKTETPFPCREAVGIAPDRRGGALVYCGDGGGIGTVSRIDGTGVTPLLDRVLGPGSASADGNDLVVTRRGACPSPAPGCQRRVVLVDLANMREREILPSGYYLGATFGWTALGLTYVQPACAASGCSGSGDAGGTFVWDGGVFRRVSELLFVAAASEYRLFERLDPTNDRARAVVLASASGQIDVGTGRALAVNARGEVLVWSGDPERALLTRYDASGAPLWRAPVEGETPVAVSADVVVAARYNMVGLPTFVVYDTARWLLFEIPLGDARVWSAFLP